MLRQVSIFLLTFLAVCLGSGNETLAQSSLHAKHNIFVGAMPHTDVGFHLTNKQNQKRYKYHVFGVDSKVGYFITDRIALGASLRWNIVRSNFTSRRPAIGPGVFGRYYLGFINDKLNSLTGTTTILGQEQPVQMSFYGELQYSLTNEALTKDNFYHVTDKIKNHLISPSIGYNFSFIRNIYLNASLNGMLFFPKQPVSNDHGLTFPRPPYGYEIGLYYYFSKKRNSLSHQPQIVPMAKHAVQELAKLKNLFLRTDSNRSNNLVLGTAGTFFPFKGGGIPSEVTDSASYYIHEGTWTAYIGYDLNKFFRTGLKSMTIFTTSSYSGRRTFWRGGPYLQFDFLGKKDGRLFIESGFYYGNYCTCGDYEHFHHNGITRWALGGGGTIPLNSNFDLNLSLLSYPILGEVAGVEDAFADIKYNIGFSYSFDL